MAKLSEYRAKRDFKKTREPKPKTGRSHRQPIFVVQEHHARRLHYDFRLEADGVLKSWAVPKAPTLDPSVKRLAVHVEDHPLEYAKFRGRIAEGQYGAGTVSIWDRGTFENLQADKPQHASVTESIDRGHVEVRLHGKKLKGDFALVRLRTSGDKSRGKDNWLLIKMKDATARAGSMRRATAKVVSDGDSRMPARVELTHAEKVMYPESGITKGDVFAYYEKIAEHLLPFLEERPVAIERYPDGIGPGRPHFWQKNTPAYYPPWIRRVEIIADLGRKVLYPLVDNVETLLYLVNQGTITFHGWFSRVESLERPDFCLFDIDPKTATFEKVIRVAQALQRVLAAEKIRSYIKTSGKSGLHLLVPWTLSAGFDEVKKWAMSIAQRIVDEMPEIATVIRNPKLRGGKVYIDTLQNARAQLLAAPYVLRGVEPARVSTPLEWKEVKEGLDPSAFNIRSILRRLSRQRQDPQAGLLWWR
jgi:bifunctional non-homologous end joining protein LigD